MPDITRTFAPRLIVALCAAVVLVSGCDDQSSLSSISHPVAEVPLLRVSNDMVKLRENDIAMIQLSADQSPRGVRWTSDDPSIVTVDPDGKIRCLRAGTTTITVSMKDQDTNVLVTVLPARDTTADSVHS